MDVVKNDMDPITFDVAYDMGCNMGCNMDLRKK